MNNQLLKEQFDQSVHRFQQLAMNTVFEIFIAHPDFNFAQSAAHEAFALLKQLENDLSRFKENSDVARINQLQPGQSTIVSPYTFECLQLCQKLFDLTGRLFDVGQGDLYDFYKGKQKPAAPLRQGSIRNLRLDRENFSVYCVKDSPSIDLGGIGKGFALDRMKEFLQDWEINRALLQGGYSSILAFGDMAWPLSIHHIFRKDELLCRLNLKDAALGASGLAKGPHIVNPLTHQPVDPQKAVWILAPKAAIADALSTSGLILAESDLENLQRKSEIPFEFLIVTPDTILKSNGWLD